MTKPFGARLKTGETLIGTIITLPSPEVAEIMAAAGFDWLFVDTEHSPYNTQGAQAILQGAGNHCPCVLRVPVNEDVWIKKALDIGANGIIVPLVNSADDAVRAVRSCKYPPEGTRGVGIGRAHQYGLGFQQYVEQANEAVGVIIQAEHQDAVANIESIVKVPGIDAVFIGPYDLSASMGKLGQINDSDVQEAIEHVKSACLAAGIRLGIFGADANAIEPYIEQGYTLIAVGTDTLFLGKTATHTLSALRR